MSRLIAVVGAIVIAVVAGTAEAQAEPDASTPQAPERLDEAARLTFEAARADFVAGRFEEALERFRQAYALSPRPGLLYNIAQTLDRLRRDEETVEALRAYLEAAPDAPNRTEVEARIRVLDEAIARRQPAEPEPVEPAPVEPVAPVAPEEPTPPASSDIGVLHPAFFISGAVLAAASAAVLIWSGFETQSLNDAYRATTTREAALPAYHRAFDQQVLTNAFIGATAALGAAVVALAIFTDWNAFGGGSGETASLSPVFAASADGAWLGLGGSF